MNNQENQSQLSSQNTDVKIFELDLPNITLQTDTVTVKNSFKFYNAHIELNLKIILLVIIIIYIIPLIYCVLTISFDLNLFYRHYFCLLTMLILTILMIIFDSKENYGLYDSYCLVLLIFCIVIWSAMLGYDIFQIAIILRLAFKFNN